MNGAPSKEKEIPKEEEDLPFQDTAAASKNQRARNFSSAEDVILCSDSINVTTNPIPGVGQKASEFRQSIMEKFDALYDSEGIDEEGGKEQRSTDAILSRFQRMIKKHRQQAVSIHLVELPSGTLESEYIDKAAEGFLDVEGRTFLYKDCVEIVHLLPKIDTMKDMEQEEEEEEEDDDDGDDGDGDEVISLSDKDRKPAAVNRAGAPMGS
jgi:hypothetical protein